MRKLAGSIVLFALTAAAGCSDPSGAGPPDFAGLPEGDPDPSFSTAAGSIAAIEAQGPSGLTSEIGAAFHTEEQPGFHREVQRIGACRLLRFEPAQCDAFCIGVCVETNVCKPYPARVSAGTLRYSGMKIPLTLQPRFQNYYAPELPPTADLFDIGDPVSVEGSGADFAAFQLTTPGVAKLETSALVNDEIRIEDGADYAFTWKPSGDPRARMRLTLNSRNRSHGLPYEGIIECDAPDTGSLIIAKELIAPFPDTFRWEICSGRDCPLSTALRYTRADGTAGPRKVSLTVGNQRIFWVLHRPPR